MASSTPTISVVTPSFNQARFVEQTLRSVLDQGFEGLEYVVIDGGSTDGSADIIARYQDRLAYWESEPDRGHAHALNKGFARTSGDIMAWLNSDDLYTGWSLATVAEIFASFPEVEWITGTQGHWDEHGRLLAAQEVHKNVYDYLLGNYEWIQQESVFWRRSLWERAGGHIDEGYRFMVDGELWSRFFLHARLHSVQCVLGGYRSHGDNRATLHKAACHTEMARAIDTMRAHCAPQTLRNASALGMLTRVRHLFTLPGPRRIGTAMLGAVLEDAAYDSIRYENGCWQRSRSAFVPPP